MGEGFSYETFAAQVGTHRDTLYEWETQHPNFSDAKKKGQALCQDWWEKMGRAGAAGKIKNFNAAVWIFSMKNRFKWHDKHEITETLNINVTQTKKTVETIRLETIQLLEELRECQTPSLPPSVPQEPQ